MCLPKKTEPNRGYVICFFGFGPNLTFCCPLNILTKYLLSILKRKHGLFGGFIIYNPFNNLNNHISKYHDFDDLMVYSVWGLIWTPCLHQLCISFSRFYVLSLRDHLTLISTILLKDIFILIWINVIQNCILGGIYMFYLFTRL